MIYNTSKLDLQKYYENGWTVYLTPSLFPHINNMLRDCGQELFNSASKPELSGIPSDYVNPPIKIRANTFKVGLSESTDKSYSIVSLHSPLNVTLETISPVSWVFNARSIRDQYRMMMLIMARCPIIFIDNGKQYILNFLNFLHATDTPLNAYFNFNNIDYKNFSDVASVLLGYNSSVYPSSGLPNYSSQNEKDYALFRTMYNEGAFNGLVSPIANDYVQGLANGEKSDFSNVSFLKCLFQITLLGIAYNTSGQYTLNNACVIIHKSGNGIKFTGKYWKKQRDCTSTTPLILQSLLNRIIEDTNLMNKIKSEIDIDIKKMSFEKIDDKEYKNNVGWSVISEPFIGVEGSTVSNIIWFAQNLLKIVLGLEDTDKDDFALFIAGMIGHSWDTLLRFIRYDYNPGNMDKEIALIKRTYPNLPLVRHYGTPLASYLFDYKNSSESNILAGYNAINFSKLLHNGLMSFRDNIKTETTYTPAKEPNALFPVVFNNVILECNTDCYRSYKKLLSFMKTRKQRELLFDNLTSFGRRAMTILDPYGIFMHFQREERGLASSDWKKSTPSISYSFKEERQTTFDDDGNSFSFSEPEFTTRIDSERFEMDLENIDDKFKNDQPAPTPDVLGKKRERDIEFDYNDAFRYTQQQYEEPSIDLDDLDTLDTDIYFKVPNKVKKKYREKVDIATRYGFFVIGLLNKMLLRDWKPTGKYRFGGDPYTYVHTDEGWFREYEYEVYENQTESVIERWQRLQNEMYESVKDSKLKKPDKQSDTQLDFFRGRVDKKYNLRHDNLTEINEKLINPDNSTALVKPTMFERVRHGLIDWMFFYLRNRGVFSWISTAGSLALLGVGNFFGLGALTTFGSRVFMYSGIANVLTNILNDIFIRGLGPRELVNRYNIQYAVADILIRIVPILYLQRMNVRGINDLVPVVAGQADWQHQYRVNQFIANQAVNVVNVFDYWLNPMRLWLNPDQIRNNWIQNYNLNFHNYMDVLRRIYGPQFARNQLDLDRYEQIQQNDNVQAIIQNNENRLAHRGFANQLNQEMYDILGNIAQAYLQGEDRRNRFLERLRQHRNQLFNQVAEELQPDLYDD